MKMAGGATCGIAAAGGPSRGGPAGAKPASFGLAGFALANPLLADIPPTVLFLAGLALVVAMTTRWVRRRRRAAACSPVKDNPASEEQRASKNAPPYAALEVRLEELSRDLMGELNTKIVIVEQLVLQAEQQATRLESLLERAEHLAESLETRRQP